MEPTPQGMFEVARGGQTYGPYTWAEVVEHARAGRIGRNDKILDPRTGAWANSTQVPGLFGAGGVAVIPAGIAAAAKLAAAILVGLAVLLGTATSLFMWAEGIDSEYLSEIVAGIPALAQDTRVNTSTSATLPPEGLTFKGTFRWEDAYGTNNDPCYLWIYTTDDGTAASFDFGLVDGWPLYLESQSGSRYIFEMSTRSSVGRVKMNANITDTSASGTITNIDWVADSFKQGTFTCTAIPYEQYRAETD